MRLSALAVLALGTLLAPSSSAAQVFAGSVADSGTVSVHAVAEALVPPTRAVLFLEVASSGPDAAAAARTAEVYRGRVVEALAGRGIEDVATVGLAAGSDRGPGGRVRPPSPDGPGPEGLARTGLRVVVEDVDSVSAAASVALEAGATAVLAAFFEADGTEALRAELAQEAVDDARREAEVMARAAGGELGDLVRLVQSPDYLGITSEARFFGGGWVGRGVELVPSEVVVRVSVQGVWAVRRP